MKTQKRGEILEKMDELEKGSTIDPWKIEYFTIQYVMPTYGFKNMPDNFKNQIGKIHDSINKGQRQG